MAHCSSNAIVGPNAAALAVFTRCFEEIVTKTGKNIFDTDLSSQCVRLVKKTQFVLKSAAGAGVVLLKNTFCISFLNDEDVLLTPWTFLYSKKKMHGPRVSAEMRYLCEFGNRSPGKLSNTINSRYSPQSNRLSGRFASAAVLVRGQPSVAANSQCICRHIRFRQCRRRIGFGIMPARI